ncbi:MAG TPA: hypothetical protein VIX15_01075 [Streptosporangiaceae bacterium]
MIDDERDLRERLEAAFGAITPRSAPVDGAVRRGRAIRVWQRAAVAAGVAAVAAGVAAVVAIGVFAVPALPDRPAAPAPVAPVGPYTVTVQAPGPHAAPGEIALGTINRQGWQFIAAKPGTAPGRGAQFFTTLGPAFAGQATSQLGPALAGYGAAPASFLELTCGPVQVQYGAVAADVTHVAVRLDNGTVLTLHPVAVYGVRAVAFAIPVGAGITEVTAYSRHGVIAAATPFNDPSGTADFGVWLRPGQHGLARASGRIGSGTFHSSAWSATAYLGPWGICIRFPAGVACVPDGASVDSSATELTSGELSVAAGGAPASTALVIVYQPDGTSTTVRPVTVGGQKLFALQVRTGPNRLGWTDYDSSGAVVGSMPG